MSAALTRTLDEFLSNADWFDDPARPREGKAKSPIIVIDDFYPDPHAVREIALGSEFVQYIPPDPAIVGHEVAARNAHRRGRWLSSAFVIYHGELAEHPFYGFRHNPDSLLHRLEGAVGEPIRPGSWESAGDYWNGAFHLVERGFAIGEGVVHHHDKPGDLEHR